MARPSRLVSGTPSPPVGMLSRGQALYRETSDPELKTLEKRFKTHEKDSLKKSIHEKDSYLLYDVVCLLCLLCL